MATSIIKDNLKHEINALYTTSNPTVTAEDNVVIDVNNSRKCGRTLFLNVKGHTTGDVINAKLFTIIGVTPSVTNITFPIGISTTAWNITEVGYGYVGADYVVGNMSSGKYFHICIALLCNM